MKASEVKLTKTVIDASQPRDRRYSLWDSELKGFGVRIGVGGVKTFVAKCSSSEHSAQLAA